MQTLAQESKPGKYLKNKRELPLSTGKGIPYLLLLSLYKTIRDKEGTTVTGKIGHFQSLLDTRCRLLLQAHRSVMKSRVPTWHWSLCC
jgi:hypothetical protein